MDARFRAVRHDHEKDYVLFVRMKHVILEILDSDKAYEASISNPLAVIAGSTKPPTEELVSLVLSIPKTTGVILSNELQLRCNDKSSVQLLITLPVTNVSARGMLQALHSGLMLAAASLEGLLLQISGADMRTEITEATPESLETLHGPLIAGGQPIELHAAFRRVAGADSQFHAARAFAVATVAEDVRREILRKRKERQDQERRKRQRERERVREAKRQVLVGHRTKRRQPNLFETENDSADDSLHRKVISKKTMPKKGEMAELQRREVAPTVNSDGPFNPKNSHYLNTGTAMRTTDSDDSITKSKDPRRTEDLPAKREPIAANPRKKRRKVQNLV